MSLLSDQIQSALDGEKSKKTVDQYLDEVDYVHLNAGDYVPSEFALNFSNFIKLVNGDAGESHPTPVVHLRMLDRLAGPGERLANLCSRGLGKTTLLIEYLVLYIACFGEIEGFGKIDGMIYVSDSMENGVKSARKNIEHRYENSEFLKKWIPQAKFTDAYLEFTNADGHKLGVKMFGAQTGLRGTKIFGKRPVLAVLDDLVSDEDARSKTVLNAIKDTIYKGVDYALDPTRRKIVFSGTPFNKNDPLYEAVESGAWDVNVWPICERFPCTREEFRGAWEERFTYDYVKKQYEDAKLTGQMASFLQELMLRITSDEDKLIHPQDIRWYSRTQLLKHRSRFNFYITTDLSTSEKQGADYGVIAVWAYSNNGDWFWVDGTRERQHMDKHIDDLFKLVSQYHPMSVGIEVSGQQGAFIQWLQGEMMNRNVWFTLASSGNSNNPGIRPQGDKVARFNIVLPWFKQGKIYFPQEGRTTKIIQAYLEELGMITPLGIKSKNDDTVDSVSMLGAMKVWKPSEEAPIAQVGNGLWEIEEEEEDTSPISSYTV